MDNNYFIIKAFSTDPLLGNPAGVVILDSPIAKYKMQRVAAINGFPETVFIHPNERESNVYHLWWFTPKYEVFDAGHATLSAQYVISNYLRAEHSHKYSLVWDNGCREVFIHQYDRLYYSTNTKLEAFEQEQLPKNIASSGKIYQADEDLVIVLDATKEVLDYQPDYNLIMELPFRGLAITATDTVYDYCSRFFAPKYGVNEDFVTASSHKYLSQYWMNKTQNKQVTGIQYSNSEGVVTVENMETHIEILGKCCIYSQGKIHF